MIQPYKFGWLPDGSEELPYEYPNIWAIEKTSGPDRLVIAPKAGYIQLLLSLTECLQAPYFLLYVLTLPRGGGEAGRYESKHSFTFDQLQSVLYDFSELLERDSRNSIWVQGANGLLVYDRHNVIYAYGPLSEFKQVLLSKGLTEATEVRFPSPHTHRYNFQFDDDQARILRDLEWIHSPLRPGDENPE
jgi:hypothetical protein